MFPLRSRLLPGWASPATLARAIGAFLVVAGAIGLIFAPFIGDALFSNLWGIEPLAYIGAILVMFGLGITSLSYVVPHRESSDSPNDSMDSRTLQQWSQTTQQYFELFDHDLGRPLRRILGKEREIRAVLDSSGAEVDPGVNELLDEIERQVPNFRLMMSNIQVLVQLDAPGGHAPLQPLEPSEVVRRIVDRYSAVAAERGKEVTWWAEPAEFGIVYAHGPTIEHVVTNLVDNAVRFATTHVEVKLTRNPSHFFVRVWDDGAGVLSHYLPHIFDRGWTPEVARGEDRSSSGLGLFIARTLAHRQWGDLTVESTTSPDPDHHTSFLLSLPIGSSQ
ncbi:MAG: HAMP domain-containing histidine kinase [Chloroflexi bacterium]|nr:HAMP domain-containing histidine kinase [Chloroflexota bacterium]